MGTRRGSAAARQLETLFNLGVIGGLSDGQLLERFSAGQGEAAELAFASLVERHGPMVLRACRAAADDPQDAQDAFQATFLVLVTKARGLWARDSLGPWLYQVAVRTAGAARRASARRRRYERAEAEAADKEWAGLGRGCSGGDPEMAERGRVLHEEIARLPERYRVPIVLCDLEGLTCEEAARRMRRPVGTVKSWRARGRERLRGRLVQRGLGPSSGLSVLPRAAADPALYAAVGVLSRGLTAGAVPASVRVLVQGVLTTMLLIKLRTTVAAALAAAVLAAGVGAAARVGSDDAKPEGVDRGAPPPGMPGVIAATSLPRGPGAKPFETAPTLWQLTLKGATRIALDNSDLVRVLALEDDRSGAGPTIAPLVGGSDSQQFRSEVTALVRTVVERYWILVQQQAQLWATTRAVELAEETLKREQSELKAGRGTVGDVAEAGQRLEQFRLVLVTKTTDVITAERQLRNLLGLPTADDRRINPVTPPRESAVEPDREACREAMMSSHPDIVREKRALEEPGPRPDHLDRVSQENRLRQVVFQATNSLDRFLLEVDGNYKQFKTAARFRTAANDRLEAQRQLLAEGRISIDRYLDAVSQYASAVAQEAQFKTGYNISLVALEEARGTLLEDEKIRVAGGPARSVKLVVGADGRVGPAVPAPAASAPPVGPSGPESVTPVAVGPMPTAEAVGKTLSFRFTVGSGPNPAEIRGSITFGPAQAAETEAR